jgi:hypothetical protein
MSNLVRLTSLYAFNKLNKPLEKSWLKVFTVRSHDRVEKCKILFKEGIPEFVYSYTWLKSFENSSGIFNGSEAIDFLEKIIIEQNGKKRRRGKVNE